MGRRFRLFGLVLWLSILAASGLAYAEEEEPQYGWKNELVGNLNLTQASFDNWAQGGENTLGWQTNLNGKFTNLSEKAEWMNAMKLAYGMTKVGDQETRKSVDEMRLETVLIYKTGFYVDPYVAATAETQFSIGYQYADSDRTAISHFLDPGYFSQSIGIGRSYRDVLRSRLGVSVRETVADQFAAVYSDAPETGKLEKSRIEVGMESVTDLDLKLSQNLLLTSKVELFSNLEATKEIDVRWDNLLTAKVEEYFTATLNVRVFYDSDISSKRQIKEALALGLTYSFL